MDYGDGTKDAVIKEWYQNELLGEHKGNQMNEQGLGKKNSFEQLEM